MTRTKEPFPHTEPEEILAIAAEHSQAYNNDREPIPVKFTEETSHITPDGQIRLNPLDAWETAEKLDLTEEEAIRILLDTLSHEIEHYNESDLSSKKKMVNKYPQAPKIAGTVINIVEDCYIDHKRLKRFEGLQKPFEEATEARLTHFKDINPAEPVEAMIKTLTVTMRTGKRPKNLKKPWLIEFSEYLEEKYVETVEADKQGDRASIAEEITATILDNIDTPEEPPELTEELIEELKEKADKIEREAELLTEEEIEKIEEETSEKSACNLDIDIEELEEKEEEIEAEEGSSGGAQSGGEESGSEETSSGSGSEAEEEEAGEETGEGSSHSSKEPGEKPKTEKEKPSKTGEETSETEKTEKQEEEKPEQFQYDGEKFHDTEVGGGTYSKKGVTLGELSETGFRKAKTSADTLSSKVKKVLEQLEEEKNDTREINAPKGGDLDIKKSIRYIAGDKTSRDIYRRTIRDNPDNRTIGITIDGSGSMDGKKMRNALEATGAVGKASKILDDQFTANTFWSSYQTTAHDSKPEDTDTSWITRIDQEFDMNHTKDVQTRHREPIALGVQQIRSEMQKSDAQGDRIIFVVHDGNPTITTDGTPGKPPDFSEIQPGFEPVEEAKNEIEKTRELGFKVIGIAVGGAPKEEVLDHMFGSESWFRFTPEEMAEKILTIYRNQ